MTSKISVIIPTYNVAAFVRDSLQSAISQTREPDEIIVIDDCSTDDTVEVIRSISDSRVKLLSTEVNSGSAVARNIGITAAKNDYIAFLDGDDLWRADHCAEVAGLLDKFPATVLAFSMTDAFGTENWQWKPVIPEHEPVNCFWECVPRTVVPQMSVVARRQALVDIGCYRPALRQTQDYDLFLRLAYQQLFVCTHKLTSRYRRHSESVTKKSPLVGLGFEYQARHLFWTENKDSMPDSSRALFEHAMRMVWTGHLQLNWTNGDYDTVEFHLSQHKLVPGSDRLYDHWKRRLSLNVLRPLWAMVPKSLKTQLKKPAQLAAKA